MFEQAGFEVSSIDWLEGYYGTASYQLRGLSKNLPLWPKSGEIWARLLALPVVTIIRILGSLLAPILARLDQHTDSRGVGYPKNYVVLAKAI